MTAFTKIIFSAAFLAAGFGLASMFGPPELADRVAEAMRPAEPAPGWGSLQPLAAASLSDPAWAEYEAAAFQPVPSVGPQMGRSTPALLAESTPVSPPAWGHRNDPAVTNALAEAAPRGYSVSTTAWRDSSAPVGWPTPPAGIQAPRQPARDITPIGSAVPSPPPMTAPPINTPPNVAPASPFGSSFSNNASSSNSPSNRPLVNAGEPSWLNSPATGNSRAAAGDSGGSLGWPPPATSPPAATGGWGQENWGGASSVWPPQSAVPPVASPVSTTRSTTPVVPIARPLNDQTPVTPIAAAEDIEPESREPVRHVVGDGDTLVRLAARYLDDPQRAGEIFLANQPTLTHPELLPIGAELVIPNRADAPVPVRASSPVAPFARLMGPQPVVAP